MTIFTRISLLVAFLLPLSLLSCRNGDGSNITGKPGDLPDEVVSLSVENPRQALALIDSAESGQLMTPFECEYLRCVTYHNGLSQYRMAILHGTKAYEMPEARDNADNFLALVEMLADEYLSMGDHSESTRLCAEGLKLAKDSLLIKREANLHVTMGLNLLDKNLTTTSRRAPPPGSPNATRRCSGASIMRFSTANSFLTPALQKKS